MLADQVIVIESTENEKTYYLSYFKKIPNVSVQTNNVEEIPDKLSQALKLHIEKNLIVQNIISKDSIKYNKVKILALKLRADTSYSLMDCKRALYEKNMDYEKAKQWLLAGKHLKNTL